MTEGDIERLCMMLDDKELQLKVMRAACDRYAKERSDLIECLSYFVSDKYKMPLERAILRAKGVLEGKSLWDLHMGEKE
jgi:hypothetical protein